MDRMRKILRDRRNRKANQADPVRHAAELERRRQRRAEAKARKESQPAAPIEPAKDIHRAHGPFAALFALQAAA